MEFTRYLRNFQRARLRADLAQAWSRLTGRSIDLLDFEEVRRRLHAELTGRRTLREIPIAAIVGSVGRPGDFTRDFLPLNDRDAVRWAEVKHHFVEPRGVPPIEVYQVGEVYFVLDGNHRVSVARDLGATHIEAYVTEVRTPVPLTPDTDPRELILKARYVEFLERTRLDRLRPGADLQVTRLGHYAELERHIHLHRYVMGIEQRREVPEAEAVADWYDRVYLPVVRAIREHGTLERFPGRTETDLYLAVSGYRLLMEEYLDWEFENGALGDDDPVRTRPGLPSFLGRVLARLSEGDLGDVSRVLPGMWRRKQVSEGLPADFRLFTNLLVPVTGSASGWAALDLAAEVAHREHGRVLGLHVVPEAELRTHPRTLAVKAEFERRCQAAGIPGRLAVEVGEVAGRICERSAWVDMTVVRLEHPPRPEPWARLGSGFRSLVRSCASPLLATPLSSTLSFTRALVAYNGSPKAEGALQVAAYLAQRWGLALAVVSVSSGGFDAEAALARACDHLAAWNVTAAYLGEVGPVAEVVLRQADAQASDLIIMGGYGHGPFLEIALGSTVDHVLRHSLRPTLICP
jgi:nucleotide-binding universal stress UspA family protein